MSLHKSLKTLFITILLVLLAAFAYAAPVKKTPAKEGNFEVIQGNFIAKPIDVKLMQESIVKAATNLGWIIQNNVPGETTLRLSKKNSWWVVIKVCYTENEYWYEYVDSNNLGANPAKNKIHRNYTKRWIPNLEKHISRFYYHPEQQPRLTFIPVDIPDNFTNVTGRAVITPIDTEKFRKAATKSAASLNWQIIEDKNGEITIRYSRGNWWVVTKIVYNKNGYNYVYVDSYNLDADIKNNKIHRNYLGRWIPNLEKYIASNYF